METIEFDAGNIGLYRLTNPYLHQFCICVAVRAGCMYESREENGCAHLYEHMVFRNLKRHFGGGFYTLLAKHGIDINATTYPDSILFYVSGIKEGFAFACEILTHLFDDIAITAEEFRAEKQRIKAEIREEEERKTLSYRCNQAIWNSTPLSRTVHGYCANIDRASLPSVNRYKNTILCEGNVFAVLTGNADENDISLLKRTLNGLRLTRGEAKTNLAQVPQDFLRRPRRLITQNEHYTRVFLSFDNADTLSEKYTADLLCYVLFYGYDSLVNEALSENNPLIYSYDCWNSRYSNVGVFTLEYEVDAKDLEESLSFLAGCFRALKAGRFDFETNLQKAITGYICSFDSAYHKCKEIANLLVLCNGDLDMVNHEPQMLRGVTKEDVIRLAEKVFVKNRMVLGIKGNKKKLDANVERLLQIFDNM